MTRYLTSSHTFLTFCFRPQIGFFITNRRLLWDASNELLNTYRIVIDPEYNDGYPGSCGEFQTKYHGMVYYCRLYCVSVILNIVCCIYHLNTKHETCIKKITLLVCGCCQTISNKSKCKKRVFPLCLCAAPTFRPVLTLYNISESPKLEYRYQKTPGTLSLDLHLTVGAQAHYLELWLNWFPGYTI